MDSVTQIALGAAVGEKVLGHKVGNKAPLWGAALGILPDLDVLGAAFLSGTDQLGFHRWVSHSLLFAVGGGGGIGWVLSKLHRAASWREWAALAFWAIFTHALLDCFTGYGTQLFSPFSNYPVAFGTIFVIDPLYTLPLAMGLIAALCQRRLRWRQRLNALGLVLSTAYLLTAAAIGLHARSTFAHALTAQGIAYEHLYVAPTPFNAVLWSGLAGADDHLWAGLYSLLDDDSAIRFRRIERNTHLIAARRDDPPIQRLLWFARGYYRVEHRADALYFHALRFGRSDFYLDTTGTYFFTFRLLPDPSHPERIADIQRTTTPLNAQRTNQALKRLWHRLVRGKSAPSPP